MFTKGSFANGIILYLFCMILFCFTLHENTFPYQCLNNCKMDVQKLFSVCVCEAYTYRKEHLCHVLELPLASQESFLSPSSPAISGKDQFGFCHSRSAHVVQRFAKMESYFWLSWEEAIPFLWFYNYLEMQPFFIRCILSCKCAKCFNLTNNHLDI